MGVHRTCGERNELEMTAILGWNWTGLTRHELDSVVVPPFVHGAARSIGTYKGVANTCPDGKLMMKSAVMFFG